MSRYDMIKGIIPPIITPMNEDESFNEAEFRNQIERQIEGGVHGIFCYGTNGECYALNTQEKEKILKVAVDQIKGRNTVEVTGVALSRGIALAFLGHDMQEMGAGLPVDIAQDSFELRLIVTIKRTIIVEAHILKHG